MIDGVPIPLLNGIGVVAVIVFFGLMIARGALVTRREHEAVIHDRDEWRAESRIKDQQIEVKDEQLRYMGEVGRTMEAVLSTVQRLRRNEVDQ